ncbi:MAG: gamma-glutamyltransferase family protein, partial [Pseudomonadota bacterium]
MQPPDRAAQAQAGGTQPIGSRLETGRDYSVRSAIVAPTAAAATAHPLATQIALDVMKDGGSALDAAIAANAFLGLAEPTNGSIGGDLFALVWDPVSEELVGYNGSGRSPRGASLADMQQTADTYSDGSILPAYGEMTVSVPGAVDAWFALHARFGRLPMSRLLAPSIAYAETGAPILETVAYEWKQQENWLSDAAGRGEISAFDTARNLFFSPSPVEGDLFESPDLARTYRLLATHGRAAFYTGEIARAIDAHMQRSGGALRYADFAIHQGEWVAPICADYRQARLCEIGPNTQGIAALHMLELMETFDISEMGFASADAIMLGVEAKRLAFADRARLYADPNFSNMDASDLIAPDYVSARRSQIDLATAMPTPGPGLRAADATLSRGDTTYITVADGTGMMVSLIQSNYYGMGSGVVAPGTGFMLQNRGRLFSLDPEHPNRFEPGKRPFQTIIPAFAFHRDAQGAWQPWLSYGVMGGDMQPQGHVQ